MNSRLDFPDASQLKWPSKLRNVFKRLRATLWTIVNEAGEICKVSVFKENFGYFHVYISAHSEKQTGAVAVSVFS